MCDVFLTYIWITLEENRLDEIKNNLSEDAQFLTAKLVFKYKFIRFNYIWYFHSKRVTCCYITRIAQLGLLLCPY